MDDGAQPLTEHLAELRTRLFRLLIAWGIGVAAAWNFKEEIFAVLLQPALGALAPGGGQLQAIAPTEIFFTYLKSALLGGFVLALPVIFWQLWAFVSPGLYDREKRVALPFVTVSTLLFLTGCVFGHQIVFPLMFQFFQGFESEFVESAWTMREVFGVTTRLFLAFGVAFELPVVVFFLSAAGIVSARQLLAWSPYSVLFAFVAGAVLTPADVVSQVFLAVPLVVLYFIGVGAAWLFGGRRARESATDLQTQ
jgi:sec-independent protein translocase protein TatC